MKKITNWLKTFLNRKNIVLKEDYFKEENKQGNDKEILSNSGKYKLIISYYSTKQGSWNYCKGTIVSAEDNKVIAEVKRNYSSFPFNFIEQHADGNDYLICGSDYQGQTIVDLKSGKIAEFMSDGSDEGVGFCWSSTRYNKDKNLLIVNGCVWAAPYEYRFFDFSNPMNGFKELEIIKDDKLYYMDSHEGSEPEIDGNFIKNNITSDNGWFDDMDAYFNGTFEKDYDHPDEYYDKFVVGYDLFEIKDNKIIFVKKELTDKKYQEYLDKSEKIGKAFKEKLDSFVKEDPLLLKVVEKRKELGHKDPNVFSRGVCYPGWRKDINQTYIETRFIFEVQKTINEQNKRVSFEWGIDSGPVKISYYCTDENGKTKENQKFFMEHSIDSVIDAFNYLESLK